MKTTSHCFNGFFPTVIIFFLSFTINAQVGIGTTSPTTQLDVNGGLSLREGTALALSDGANNNISLGTTPFSSYRITGPSASFSISGLVPLTNADGQIVTLENTTGNPMTLVHNSSSTAANRLYCPAQKDLILGGQYSTATLQYNATQSRWIVLSYSERTPSVDSVSLASDITITSSFPSYTAITGMSLTFTAQDTSAFVLLTASGFGFVTSLSGVYLRVYNTTSTSVVGGTMTKIQSIEPFFGSSITTWSCSFSKMMTGLTIGNTYTIRVEGAIIGVLGTHTAVIQPVTTPSAEHMTLSVLH